MQAQLARGIELDAAELAVVLVVPSQLLCIQHVCLHANNGFQCKQPLEPPLTKQASCSANGMSPCVASTTAPSQPLFTQKHLDQASKARQSNTATAPPALPLARDCILQDASGGLEAGPRGACGP